MKQIPIGDILELIYKDKRVVWEYIGEGRSGDFNPKDKRDEPLLRFSCSMLAKNEWIEMVYSSYCTNLPVGTPMKILARAASEVMEAIQDVNYKRRLEDLSHVCISDFFS